MKNVFIGIGLSLMIFFTLATSITSIAYWIKNPHKSQMEVFLHIPKSLILDFDEVDNG